jgi:hypothetical protein
MLALDRHGIGHRAAEPAPLDRIAQVEETIAAIAACSQRPGSEFQIGGFFSDDFFRRGIVTPGSGDALTWSIQPDEEQLESLLDVFVLEDGRVTASAVSEWDAGTLLVFVEEDDDWLVDEVYLVAPEYPVSAQGCHTGARSQPPAGTEVPAGVVWIVVQVVQASAADHTMQLPGAAYRIGPTMDWRENGRFVGDDRVSAAAPVPAQRSCALCHGQDAASLHEVGLVSARCSRPTSLVLWNVQRRGCSAAA